MSYIIGVPELLIIVAITILLTLPVITLVMLSRAKDTPDLVRVLWVLVILGFPVFGAVAYILTRGIRTGIDADQNREQHA